MVTIESGPKPRDATLNVHYIMQQSRPRPSFLAGCTGSAVWALLVSLPHPPPLLSVSHVLQQHSATSHSLNKLLACVPLLMLILLSGMLSPMCPMPHTVYMANTYSFWEDPDPWSLFWTPMETARCPCLYIPYALIYLAAACSDSEVLAARCCVQDISASPQCLVHDGSSDRVSW